MSDKLSGFQISAMAQVLISIQGIGTTHTWSIFHGNGPVPPNPKLWIGTPGECPLLVCFILDKINSKCISLATGSSRARGYYSRFLLQDPNSPLHLYHHLLYLCMATKEESTYK